ncbi:retrovirus-related pol polyprotein from transposon TNT 1-94 [Tanacetum coccineum]
MQQPQPNNNFILQPLFNTNYMQQPIPNPKDITDLTTAMNMALVLMDKIAQPGMNLVQDRQMQMVGGNVGNQFRQYVGQNVRNQVVQNAVQNPSIQNIGNQNGLIVVSRIANQNVNPNGNGNVVAARADGNANGNNGTQTDNAPVYDSDGSAEHEVHHSKKCNDNDIFNMFTQEEQYTKLLEPIPKPHQVQQNDSTAISTVSNVEQSGGTVEQHPANVEETQFSDDTTPSVARKFLNEVKSTIVTLQCVVKQKMTLDIHNWSSFAHQELLKIVKDEIYPIVNQVGARVQNFEIQFLKKVAKFVRDFKSLANEADESLAKNKDLEFEIEHLLRAVVSQDIMPIVQNPTVVPLKVVETNDLLNPVTSNSVPTPQESKVVKNDKVIALGMFRINPFKTSKEEKYVPNKPIKSSVRTKPITVSQPHVITKKDVNSNSNSLSSKGVDNTSKTRRPQPRSNTNNDRVPYTSKSRCIKNKEVKVEEHPRNLLLSKNKENMSSECNNIKLAIRNDKSEVKHKPTVTKPKKVGHKERLALPKPRKPRTCLRWSPTGRMFDLKGKITEPGKLESQSDCSKGHLNMFMVRRLRMFKAYDKKSKASYKFHLEVLGNRLGHNLFSVRQFCDSDLEVAFRRNTYFFRNLKGIDLLKGNRTTNLYTINLYEMAFASPICLMARATSTKSWLWHQHLSHLNFDTINNLAKNDLVTGLPKFKYHKEHLCPLCDQGKSKKASHPPKPVPNSKQRSKDKAPEKIKTFLKKIIVLLQALVIIVRTDNSIKFKNQVLKEYFDSVGISHQASFVRTPQQNRVVERRNQMLVEAARTMLIFSRAPLFLWAEVIAITCYTQNCSIIHRRFDKTPYELINSKKPDVSFLHVFGALCYPKNDREDSGKLGAKGDIGFFIGYSTNSCAYRVYNRRTKKIIKTMNVTFDEISVMAFEQRTMYDEYIGGQPSAASRIVPAAPATQVLHTPTASTTTADTAPTPTNSSSQAKNIPNTSEDVDELEP